MHGRGACMARGCAWQRVCMAGGMHARGACMAGGHAWQGGECGREMCMVGGVHDRGHA